MVISIRKQTDVAVAENKRGVSGVAVQGIGSVFIHFGYRSVSEKGSG